jgi:hypothetical protein
MSKAVKFKTCKSLVTLVVFRSETWPVTEMDRKRLNAWEGKMLRLLHELVVEQGTSTVRTNQELWKLRKDLDIVGSIKK